MTSGCAIEEFRDGRVAPGERAQLAHVVRVGQGAHVEDVVGIEGHAVPVGEAFEYQRQAAVGGAHQLAHPGAQLGRPQVAGVDDGRDIAQVGEQLALELDRLDEGAAVGERMGAPRLREAPHQRAGGGVEKDRLDGDAFAAQSRQQRQQVRQRVGAAHVDGDGDAPVAPLLLEAQEVAQQLRRQVVDAEESGVFERVQGHRLCRSRRCR